jgi:hypothetical protein
MEKVKLLYGASIVRGPVRHGQLPAAAKNGYSAATLCPGLFANDI